MSRPKFCPKCGNSLEGTGKFCGKCGTPIVDTDDAQQAPQDGMQQVPPQVQAQVPPPVQQFDSQQVPPQGQPVPPQGQQMPPQGQQVPPQGGMQQVPPQFAPQQGQFQQGYAPAPKPPKPPKDPNKTFGAWIKRHKLPIIISCVAAVLIAAGLIVFFQLTKYQKIDAQKLFAYKFKGINGSGTAVVYLNAQSADPDPYTYDRDENGNQIEKEYSDYLSTEKKTLLKAFDKASDYEQALEMRNALLARSKNGYTVKVNMDKSTGLSNGDKIKCTVEYDEEELKEVLIKLENLEFEIEVKGLVDGEKLDLFDGFDPKFTGMDENGEIDRDSMKGTYPFISYYVSSGSSYNLKNGDKLTFQASFSSYDVEDFNYLDTDSYSGPAYFKYEGKTYIIDNTSEEKEFTVSGLSEAQKVDIFEGIKFETSGADPYLKISRVNTDGIADNIKNNVSYYLDLGDQKSFKAGDTFKVKAYVSDSLLREGYKPTEDPDEDGYCYAEFTVDAESYGHYITEKCEASELDSFKDKFGEFTKKFSEDYTGKSYLGGISLDGKIKSMSGFTVAKDYIVINDGFYEGTIGAYDTKTILYRVYKVTLTITDDEGEDSDKNIYACFAFRGPYIDAKGEAQLDSSVVNITVATKMSDITGATIDKVKDGKVYEVGKGEAKGGDDSSKSGDDSSKGGDDSSERGDDSSESSGDDSSEEAEEPAETEE